MISHVVRVPIALLVVLVAVAVALSTTNVHSLPLHWTMELFPQYYYDHRPTRQLPSSSSSFLLQYTFNKEQCERGYFLPKNNESSHQDFTSSAKFTMMMINIANATAPSSATPRKDSCCCAPMLGILPHFGSSMLLFNKDDDDKDEETIKENTDSFGGSDSNNLVGIGGTATVVSLFHMDDVLTLQPPSISTKTQDPKNNEISIELWLRLPFLVVHDDDDKNGNPTRTSRSPISIVTIGQSRYDNTTSTQWDRNNDRSENICDTKQLDLQLTYTVATNEWVFTIRTSTPKDSNSPFTPCRTVTVTTTTQNHHPHNSNHKLWHVVCSIRDQKQVLYLNGAPIITLQESIHISTDWHPEYTFQFLSIDEDTANNSSFSDIVLYQCSIHSTALGRHPDDVMNLILHHTLPSVSPWAYDQSILVYEDAEVLPKSHCNEGNLAWYRNTPSSRVPTNDTAYMNGPYIMDLNRDLHYLVRDVEPPNSITVWPDLPSIYVYIVELPHLGQMYWYDDQLANPVLLLPASTTTTTSSLVFIPIGLFDPDMPRLKYIPPQNAISYPHTFTTFRYCIATSVIFDIHQCQSIATVEIVIVPVNDPPIAISSVTTLCVFEALTRRTTDHNGTNNHNKALTPKLSSSIRNQNDVSKIRLHGSDVDFGDKIVEIQIVSLPRLGYLSLAVTSFRHDMLLHGTRLSTNMILSNVDPVFVHYTFDRNTSNRSTYLTVQNNDIKDYFSFRVRDQSGWWSMEERVEIQVASSLMAYAEPIVRMKEDSMQSLHWYGLDRSIWNRQNIQFYIEKLPSLEVGQLIHPQSNITISQPGMILLNPIVSMNELELVFHSSPNVCHANTNTTNSIHNNEVRFRIVSMIHMSNSTETSNGTYIESVSDPFTQQIWIECTLDVLELSATEQGPSPIIVSGLLRTMTDPCHALQWINPSFTVDVTSCQTAAFISDINLTTIDARAAMVIVSVSTKFGLITLNPQYWNRSIPILGRPILSSGIIRFSAYPHDVTSMLSNMHYQSFIVGNDTIDIHIQYGSCPFDGPEQQYASIVLLNVTFRTATCQMLHHSIPITVLPDRYYKRRDGRWSVKFPWQLLLCLFGYPILYIVVVYLEWWYHSHRGRWYDNSHEGIQSGHDSALTQSVERYIPHEDDNGMIYFEDTVTGMTHWSIPPQLVPDDESLIQRHSREII